MMKATVVFQSLVQFVLSIRLAALRNLGYRVSSWNSQEI